MAVRCVSATCQWTPSTTRKERTIADFFLRSSGTHLAVPVSINVIALVPIVPQ